MKQEPRKWYYYFVFDEVTGALYESGEWYTTRGEAFKHIQDDHYFYLQALRMAGKKTAAEQLRSIIKDDQEEALREYKRMSGREGR